MKPLRPSIREKKRYLLVKGKIKDIERAIFEGIGVLGISKTGINWIKSDKKSVIISVNRGSVDSVKACFAIWSEKLWVEKVSGTLRGIRDSTRSSKSQTKGLRKKE